MTEPTVTVEGADTLSRTLHGAADDIGHMDGPLLVTAGKVARDAADRAPRLTGALARSIRPSYAGANTVAIGSSLPYAGRTEYGWSAVRQAARPFLRPALADNQREAVAACQGEAQHALNGVKGA